jgi:putative FmdB family regulatory protein
MPLYEYECRQCGSTFERLKPLSAMDEGEICPGCGHPHAQRVLSAFATGKTEGSASAASGCGSSRGGFS